MQELWSTYLTQASGVFIVLLLAYLLLLVSWPLFLWLERKMPVQPHTPRANYWLNWKITCSNLLLAPAFAALVTLFTVYVAGTSGRPSLEVSPLALSDGQPLADTLLQGAVIFFSACFLGDF